MKYIHLILFVIIIMSFQTLYCQSSDTYTISFKKNSYDIDKKYESILKKLAFKFMADSCRLIKIYGYTDTSGLENYNEALSKKRAYAVYHYLLSAAKFDTSKVYIEWLGESNETYDLHFPSAHIQQRSVDIWVQFNKKSSASGKKNVPG